LLRNSTYSIWSNINRNINAFKDQTSLTGVVIPNSVANIGDYAFMGATGLTSITIPNSVIAIGDSAFLNATNLTSVLFEDGSSLSLIQPYTFAGTANLSSIEIPNSVTSIGENAFVNATALVSVTFSDGTPKLTTIESSAFQGATNLVTFEIPNSVTQIGSYAFQGNSNLASITIPSNVTSIGPNAFANSTSLATVTFSGDYSSLTSLESSVFEYATSLTSIVIPSSVVTIGTNAFAYATSLASVTFAGGCPALTSIGEGAFYGAASLTSIEIPCSVENIGDSAFFGNLALTSVTFAGESLIMIGNYSFQEATSLSTITIPSSVISIGNGAFKGTNLLASVIFSGGCPALTSIGAEAFSGASSLTSIAFPCAVSTIGDFAFLNATSLNSVTFSGNSLTIIGDSVFRGAVRLASIIIPSSIATIGSNAFNSATDLTTVTFAGETPSLTSIGTGAFIHTSLKEIVIPDSVSSISAAAFYGIPTLESVILGNGVSFIGSSAFESCGSLSSVTFRGTPPTVDPYAFNSISGTATGFVFRDKGWDDILGSNWLGLNVRYFPLASAKIKGSLSSLGAPSFSLTIPIAGSVSISSVAASDTSNLEPFVTLFTANIESAITKVVKYSIGDSTVNFDTDTPFSATDSILPDDFFIVRIAVTEGIPTTDYLKFVVSVIESDVDTLSSLSISAGTLTPSFSSTTYSYSAFVSNSTALVTVTPTYIGPGETVTVRDTSNASGSPSSPIPLNVGINEITVVATAENGSQKTYVITITRAAAVGGGFQTPSFQPRSYWITYSGNTSEVIPLPFDPSPYKTGEKITVATEVPARLGYSFVEWNTRDSGEGTSYRGGDTITVTSSNFTLFAMWKINRYTVNFISIDGSPLHLDSITQDFGTTYLVPSPKQEGVRIGYTFTSWNTKPDGSGTRIAPSDKLQIGALDITLFAQWKVNQYTLTYDANGSKIGRIPISITKDFNSTVVVEAPSRVFARRGYDFYAWNTARDGSGKTFKAGEPLTLGASDQTLYAKWVPKEFQVTYLNSSSNPLPKGQFHADGVIATSPIPPLRQGYIFKGWSSRANKSDILSFPYLPGVYRNVTLYAVWDKQS
jgi:uncharacterized repeat protein (TIGR02543 family)